MNTELGAELCAHVPRKNSLIKSSKGPVSLAIAASAAVSIYAWMVFATTFLWPGKIGINYVAVGSDWMVFHAAARSYLSGHLSMIYDGHAMTDVINESYVAWLSEPLPFRPWVYPPTYLLLIAPFGLLGFLGSFLAFQVLSAVALLASVMIGAPRKDWMIACCAVACPAAAVNVVCGQNAALVAALLIGGFRLLDRYPALAGIILGLLTFKPQFAVLIPVVFVASRQWRSLFAFVASALSLALVSLIVFGFDAWAAWGHLTIESMGGSASAWLEYGRLAGYSVWACAVLLGATTKEASALGLVALLASVVAVWLAFARRTDAGRLTVLLAATLLAAPHWSQYDAMLLAIGGLLWLRCVRGHEMWRWGLFFLLWVLPLLGTPENNRLVALAPVLIVGFIVVASDVTRERIEWVIRQR